MERGTRKRSSSVGSEKMERVGGRWVEMEGHCSTGQSPQWALLPMEKEEEFKAIPSHHTYFFLQNGTNMPTNCVVYISFSGHQSNMKIVQQYNF